MKKQPILYLDITKKPGAQDAVMTADDILAENAKLKEEIAKLKRGNAAALREALRTLRQRFDNNVMAYQDRYFKFSGWHWHKKAAEAARWRDVFHELREACDAALSAPARQCDVGTAEEQERRYKATGEVYHTLTLTNALAWAQTPYAEEGEGE